MIGNFNPYIVHENPAVIMILNLARIYRIKQMISIRVYS